MKSASQIRPVHKHAYLVVILRHAWLSKQTKCFALGAFRYTMYFLDGRTEQLNNVLVLDVRLISFQRY